MAERHAFVRLAEETIRKHIQKGRIVSPPDELDDLDIHVDVPGSPQAATTISAFSRWMG